MSYVTYAIYIYIGQSGLSDTYNIEQFLLYNGYTRVESALIHTCTIYEPDKGHNFDQKDTQIRIFSCF